jgi:hypothetical protein
MTKEEVPNDEGMAKYLMTKGQIGQVTKHNRQFASF